MEPDEPPSPRRILFLAGDKRILVGLVIPEDVVTMEDPRTNCPTLDEIQTITETQDFDLVIIGNCHGLGKERAKRVSPSLRDKTIIVSLLECCIDKGFYRSLGIRHFCTRIALVDYVLAGMVPARPIS